ncbi:MAG: T9SS type A sorting domain-containing protein [candidate division Zixibacteria bacterium]|nr:T9SS type A sorting domain-containing protein [candidate division Zixibacteria bacterium]
MLLIRTITFSFIILLSGIASAGENVWTSNGPYGASSKAIAFHPEYPQVVFTGTISMSVFKTINGGRDWERISDDSLNSSVWDLEIHPVAPDTMYLCGTRGIYKSVNGGYDWFGIRTDNVYNTIALHPIQPSILFAGGPYSYISKDGGNTWNRLMEENVLIKDIEVSPHSSNTIFAVTSKFYLGKGVFRSDDSGDTWRNIHNNLDYSHSPGYSIDFDPHDSLTIYISRLSLPYEGEWIGLNKTTDGGETWMDITPSGLTEPWIRDVEVHPLIENMVFAATSHDGVWMSSNGGSNWEIRNEPSAGSPSTLEFSGSGLDLLLGKYHSGIFKTTDNGRTWVSSSNGLSEGPISSMIFHPHEDDKLYALGGAGLFSSNNGGSNWSRVEIGIEVSHLFKPGVILSDTIGSGRIFLCLNACGLNGWYKDGLFLYSENWGESWTEYNLGLPDSIFYTCMDIAYCPGNQYKIYLTAADSGVYYCDDLVSGWHKCDDGLPQAPNFGWYKIRVNPGNPDDIYVSSGFGDVFRSIDGAQSWQFVTEMPDMVTEIAFNPINPLTQYISSCAGLYKTTDNGETWVNLSEDWIEKEVYGIVFNPRNPSELIISSFAHRVAKSTDGGDTWHTMNDGLLYRSYFVPRNIFVSPHEDEKYYLTSDMGIWEYNRVQTPVDDSYIDSIQDPLILTSFPNPSNNQILIEYRIETGGDVKLEVFNVKGQLITKLVEEKQTPGTYTVSWDGIGFSSGVYFAKLKTGERTYTRKMVMTK